MEEENNDLNKSKEGNNDLSKSEEENPENSNEGSSQKETESSEPASSSEEPVAEESASDPEPEKTVTPAPAPAPVAPAPVASAPASSDKDEVEDEEEDFEKATVKSVSIKWGVILSIISISLFIVGVAADLSAETWYGLIGIIPLIIILVMAHKQFKEEGDGYMSYSQGLGIGIFVSLVSGTITGLFELLYTTVIDPEFTEKMMLKLEDRLAEQGIPDSQIDTARGMAETFSNPMISFFVGIVAAVFFGFILSLIVSAFTKNANPELDV